MVLSPYNAQQRCFSEVKRLLDSIPEAGISRARLMRELLATYSVSESALDNYIDKYFVQTGDVIEFNGVLYAKQQS